MVESGVLLPEAMAAHSQWLERHGLIPLDTAGAPTFAFVTWSDADIMGALHSQLTRLGLERPAHYDKWINLKALFKQHYKREPHGGLQKVVESCGLTFDGRAHSGLVDSQNTAKIAMQMIEQSFRFTRTTRGFGPDGYAWGAKRPAPESAAGGEEREREEGRDGSGAKSKSKRML
ncbi:hypothetical protein T484DRAFT_2592466 [Baffinella frigidus]|nr:hypothetical protein T484DRAFT_2592466 [Cryptophyta sp. CCMP2293]